MKLKNNIKSDEVNTRRDVTLMYKDMEVLLKNGDIIEAIRVIQEIIKLRKGQK